MVKVLNIGDWETINNQMDANAGQRAEALGYIKVQAGRKDKKKLDALQLYEQYKPDVILHEFVRCTDELMVTNLDKVPCPTVLLLEDEHSTQKGLVEPFTDVILMYQELIPKWKFNYPNKHFHYMPHHVNQKIYKDLKIEKEYDVLFYGNLNPKFYPERKQLLNLLRQGSIKLKELPYSKDAITGHELAKEINKARFAVVTPSILGYTVAKYFEIPMCGTIPIGEHTPTSEALFKDSLLTDKKFKLIGMIEFLRNNKSIYDAHVKILKEAVKDFTLEKYKEKMDKLMRDINDR